MAKMNLDVRKMSELQAKDILEKLIEKLDELDLDDYFGTEGWRHLVGFDE